jgi:hypothetical protein
MSVSETVVGGIDIDAIRTHHQIVWANYPRSGDTSLAVSYRSIGSNYLSTERVAVQDANAFVDLVARKATDCDVWVNVAPQLSTTERRGGRKDALALPALFADIDVIGGVHKTGKDGLPLPSDEEALEIITKFPLQPTLLVRTGGGYHVWVALDAPLDHRTPEGQAVLNGWKTGWIAEFEKSERYLDEGILADVARMLRVAGTLNCKDPENIRPVTIVDEPGDRVTLADALELLPKHPAPVSRYAAPISSPSSTVDENDDTRPGTLLKRAVPVSALLEPVLEWVKKRDTSGGGARWSAPDSTSGEEHAESYPSGDEGCETVTVFGERLAEILDMDSDHRTWNSWDLLIWRCGGNANLAARVARQCPDTESLTCALITHTTAEALAEAFPEITASVPEAISAGSGNNISVGKSTYAIIGGRNHGLWLTTVTQDVSGKSKTAHEPIADWIAWRPEMITQLRINDRCQPEPVGPVGTEKYTVEVVTKTGRRYSRSGFAAKDSTSARYVIDATNAGVELPISVAHRGMADNMLRTLGHRDQRNVASYTSIGWCYPDGKTPVYICPNGSVSPDGVTDAYAVGPHGESDATGLGTAMRRTGFAGADIPVDEAAEALRLFCEIASDRPEIAVALLGLIFSAPLRLAVRGVVVITGETDSGKTLLSSAVQSFFSDVAVGDKDASSLYIPSSSKVGAEGVMAWYRDGLAVCDDYRRSDDDRNANIRMGEVISALVQSGYGASPGAKATQTGGMRGSRDQAASVLITAEVSADQAAIRNRSITLSVGRAQQVTKRGGPLDAFKAIAQTGAARSLMAHYLTYLARRAAGKSDGLEKMSLTMKKRAHSHYLDLDGNRNAETVAALATGWETFREFAKAAGIESFLPSESAVDRALRMLAASNADAAAESDPGRRVIAQMSAMLVGNTGHLLSNFRDRPVIDGYSPGWASSTSTNTNGECEQWRASGAMLGYLSADQSAVVVVKAGIQAGMRAAHLEGLTEAQVYDAVARLTMPGSKAGERCPSSLGIDGRPAGFVLPVELLGLGSVVDPAETSELDQDEPFYDDF